MLITFVLIFVSSLLRGGKKSDSVVGLTRCSSGDLSILIVVIICTLIITLGALARALKEQRYKDEIGFLPAPSDVHWGGMVSLKLALLGTLGGMVSGLLGIGAGVLFNPLLLSIGVHPLVTSATGMYMVMFISGSSSMLFIVGGNLNLSFAFWIAVYSVLATYVGIKQINKVVQRSGRGSLVVVFLAFIIALSAAAIPVLGALQEKKKSDEGEDIWAFNSFC